MSGNLKSYIYNELKVSSSDINTIINSFSAYLDEFDRDFKYNYKFLVSHIEDFETSNLVHRLFKEQCGTVIQELIKEKSINNAFAKVLHLKDRMSCKIDFNNALEYPIKEVGDTEDPWRKIGTLPKWTWEKIKENKCVELNISIEFRYDNLHFSKRYFNVNTEKKEHLGLVCKFFNDSYRSIVTQKIEEENYQKLKALRHCLTDEYSLKVVIDDIQSMAISRNVEENYLAENVILLENNINLSSGTFFISNNGNKYKYTKSRLKDIELIKQDLIPVHDSNTEDK